MVAGRGRLLLAATAAILLCQACGQARAHLSSGWPSGQFCPDDDSLAYRCNAPGEGCNLVDCQPDHRCLEVVCNGTCLPRCFKTPGAGGVNLCPDGKPPNTCFVDPCSLARCPSGTVCSSNYCTRGAKACTATCKKAGTVCPDGQPLAYCFIDPCHPSIAPKCTAGQVCYRNYCGGCTAFCAMPDSKVCPDGNPPDNCLIDPCSTNPCEPGDTCRPGGSCSAALSNVVGRGSQSPHTTSSSQHIHSVMPVLHFVLSCFDMLLHALCWINSADHPEVEM